MAMVVSAAAELGDFYAPKLMNLRNIIATTLIEEAAVVAWVGAFKLRRLQSRLGSKMPPRFVTVGTRMEMAVNVVAARLEIYALKSINTRLITAMTRIAEEADAGWVGDWSSVLRRQFGWRTSICAISGTRMVTVVSVEAESAETCAPKLIVGRSITEMTRIEEVVTVEWGGALGLNDGSEVTFGVLMLFSVGVAFLDLLHCNQMDILFMRFFKIHNFNTIILLTQLLSLCFSFLTN